MLVISCRKDSHVHHQKMVRAVSINVYGLANIFCLKNGGITYDKIFSGVGTKLEMNVWKFHTNEGLKVLYQGTSVKSTILIFPSRGKRNSEFKIVKGYTCG